MKLRRREMISGIVGAMSLTLATLAPAAALASSVTGKILQLYTRETDGLQMVEVEGRGARPACATQTYMLIRDEKSESGKAQFAMLMAAFLADRQVIVFGSDTCTRWPDGEDITIVEYAR